MVKTKVVTLALAAFALVSCNHKGPFTFEWTKYQIDGHRTGVTVPNANNVDEALGTIENGVYTSPNGKQFSKGSTPLVAQNLRDVQPDLARLKEVIAYAPREMAKARPESELSNYIVDCIRKWVADSTGRQVDVAITNFGGIRVDLAKGDILLDDIESMLPFNNYLCYLKLKGSDLQYWFEYMAENAPQCISGAKLVVKDGKLESATIGGKPIDPNKYYGVGTIDFLLDGGDGLKLARNAADYIQTDVKICDAVLADIRRLTAEGKPLEYHTDGRFIVK